MLKIQNKTYLTDSEVNKYIAFLMKFPTYICIPYKPYKDLLREYTLQEYRHDQFNIININNKYYYDFNIIYSFLLSLNLTMRKDLKEIRNFIFSNLVTFTQNLK